MKIGWMSFLTIRVGNGTRGVVLQTRYAVSPIRERPLSKGRRGAKQRPLKCPEGPSQEYHNTHRFQNKWNQLFAQYEDWRTSIKIDEQGFEQGRSKVSLF